MLSRADRRGGGPVRRSHSSKDEAGEEVSQRIAVPGTL